MNKVVNLFRVFEAKELLTHTVRCVLCPECVEGVLQISNLMEHLFLLENIRFKAKQIHKDGQTKNVEPGT